MTARTPMSPIRGGDPAPTGAPHGVLLVDKAPDRTSHDVVARVRWLLGTKKVGHAGTLDPMATGLLVLGVGQGTRLLADGRRIDRETDRGGEQMRTAALDGDGRLCAIIRADGNGWKPELVIPLEART